MANGDFKDRASRQMNANAKGLLGIMENQKSMEGGRDPSSARDFKKARSGDTTSRKKLP